MIRSKGMAAALVTVVAAAGSVTTGLLSPLPATAASGGSVTAGPVTPQPATAGSSSSYAVTFAPASALGAGDTLTFTAPPGTDFQPCSSGCDAVYAVTADHGDAATVSSAAVSSAKVGTQDSSTANQVVLTLATSTIAGGDTVTVTTSGTTNPQLAGTYSLDESTSQDPTPVASDRYTITASSPASVTPVQGGGSAQEGTPFSPNLEVAVADGYGNPVPNVDVTFTAPASAPSGTFDHTAGSACPNDTDAQECIVATDASGQATASPFTADSTAGSFQVTAQVAGGTGTPSTSFTMTNTALPPATVTPGAVTVSNATAGATGVTYTVTFTAKDQVPAGDTIQLVAPDGTTFAGCSLTLTGCSNPTITYSSGGSTHAAPVQSAAVAMATGPGATSVSPTDNQISMTVQSGSANPTFSAIPAGSPVTVTLTGATNPTAAARAYVIAESDQVDPGPADTSDYAVAPGAPQQILAQSGSAQSTTVGQRFASALTAVVEDVYGNPVGPGTPITFVLPPVGQPSGNFPGASSQQTDQTNASGLVTSSAVTADHLAGDWNATAELSKGASPIDFALTNDPGAPAGLVAAGGGGQSAPVTTDFTAPLTATVDDGFGNPVPGVAVTFTAPSTGAGGTFGNCAADPAGTPPNECVVDTDSTGMATAGTLTAGQVAGPYQVAAVADGLQDHFDETDTPGPAASVQVVSGTPQTTTTGAPFGLPLVARVVDAYQNPVPGDQVTFAAPTGTEPSGTFDPTGCSGATAGTPVAQCVVTTDQHGEATSSAYTTDATSGTQDVTATDSTDTATRSLTPATFVLRSVSTSATALTATSGDGQSATVGAAYAQPLVVTATDTWHNAVPDLPVTYSITSGAASFDNGTATDTERTDSQGQASVAVRAGSRAGTVVVTVTPQGASSPSAAFTLSNVAGAASTLLLVSGGGQSAHVERPFADPVVVGVADTDHNAVPGQSVTFTLPSAGPSPTFAGGARAATVTTDSRGLATAPALQAGGQPGNYTMVVTTAVGATLETVDVPLADRDGYWLVGSDGSVQAFGDAVPHGSPAGRALSHPVVGMVATPDEGGYWLVASDGGVFSYGDAVFHGSTGGITLNKPIVGMAATPDGGGYWLVASDGGVFSFGDAHFHGSTGGITLNKPIVGMAATPDGGGYWLVASDGGVFAFGDARFYGSTGGITLNKPIVAMAAAPAGNGYWLVASDGGVFSFGPGSPFYGSTGNVTLAEPVVGVSAVPSGRGYRFVAHDGGIFGFGPDAVFEGSGAGAGEPVVGMADG